METIQNCSKVFSHEQGNANEQVLPVKPKWMIHSWVKGHDVLPIIESLAMLPIIESLAVLVDVFESLVVLPRDRCVLGFLLNGLHNVILLVWRCERFDRQIVVLSFLGNGHRRWDSGTAYTIDSIVVDRLRQQDDYDIVHRGNVRIVLPIMVSDVALAVKRDGVSLPMNQTRSPDQVSDPVSFGKPSPRHGVMDQRAHTPLQPLR